MKVRVYGSQNVAHRYADPYESSMSRKLLPRLRP
jgi:hypothetical protein